MNVDTEATWKRIEAQLVATVGSETHSLWLAELEPLAIDGGRVVLAAPDASRRWIQERFGALIRRAAGAVLGCDAELEIRASGETPPAAELGREFDAAANPRLTFEQFVIGDGNRLAHAAALAVAELPAHAYNPLFICGPPGVGKTHLLNAIANLARLHSPSIGVRIVTGEAFTNDFLAALAAGSTERFKARFRELDILLLDDVQFLERKTRTEEEFFHTFNALHEAGRQIVISSDRPPSDLRALEERLRQRFQAGLVTDIAAPDYETRLTILRKRAASDNLQIADDDVLREIAGRVTANVRDLEGALIRSVAYASLSGRPLSAALAADVLDRLHPESRHAPTPTVAEIQQATCARFGITPDELLARTRSRRVLWPRQVAMYLARELTDESLPTIGRQFDGRDHTTVLNAWRRTGATLARDTARRSTVEDLRASLAATPRREPAAATGDPERIGARQADRHKPTTPTSTDPDTERR